MMGWEVDGISSRLGSLSGFVIMDIESSSSAAKQLIASVGLLR
jgi:hypothetical protein